MTDKPKRIGHGRYELRSLIGRGGMAEVHSAYDTALSRLVAIKMLRIDLVKDPIFLARFRREAQASASLNHENIVAVYDTGEEPTMLPDGSTVAIPYIVMEYVEGHTVHDLISDGQPVPINEAIEITNGILLALEYAHRHGLVHRDIKPGNVMLTNDGKIKVMDFGIARAMADSGATMTQTDAVVGTAQYLSPEQARGEQVDTRSDLYSCGCMLFEMLTGRPPFRGDSAVAVAYQHVAEMPPTPSSITHDIPPILDRVVLKSLAKRREDRYQDAEAMRSDLERALIGSEVDAPQLGDGAALGNYPNNEAATSVMAPVAATTTMAAGSLPPAIPPTGQYPGPYSGQYTGWNLPPTGTDYHPDSEKKKAKNKKKIWAALGGVIVILLILGGLAYSGILSSGEKVTIPTNIVGQTFDQAKAQLEGLGLTVTKGDDVANDSVEKGKVAESDPAAGSSVAKGSQVTLKLSSGPSEQQLPDLRGKSTDEARAALEELGLKVGNIISADDSELEPNQVISTKPEAGAMVKTGQAINLVVNSGYVDVDDDQVNGQDEGSATAYLSSLGLKVQSKHVVSNTQFPGTVLRYSPSNRVKIGSTVTIYVTDAPPQNPITPTPSKPSQKNKDTSSNAPSSKNPGGDKNHPKEGSDGNNPAPDTPSPGDN